MLPVAPTGTEPCSRVVILSENGSSPIVDTSDVPPVVVH